MPVSHGRLFREYLETCDLPGVRKLWSVVSPHLPQPKNDFETMVMVHRARTEAASIPFRKRAYSHQWLQANGIASGLPNDLKPKAEQIEFTFAYGVGFAVVNNDRENPEKSFLTDQIRSAMSDAAAEAVAYNRIDTAFLNRHMADARRKRLRELGRPKITVKIGYDLPSIATAINRVR